MIRDERGLLKDEVLDRLADNNLNVAQFVSFEPVTVEQRFCRIHNIEKNFKFQSIYEAVNALISASSEKKLNIRTFRPFSPKGNPFERELNDVSEIVAKVTKLAQLGFFIILNESIDINDGGVSGVVMGDILEFSPQDTPRCVEKPGVCSLEKSLGLRILSKVYGFRPKLDFGHNFRVEFSIHPLRRGYQKDHTIIWEIEEYENLISPREPNWPNNFSRFLGDKVFGLLIAHEFGMNVPSTTVLPRNIAPFTFGIPTGTAEIWIRTCPAEKKPGYFPTYFGWKDPFDMMNTFDKDRSISSVISQQNVESKFSGAAAPGEDGLIIEGVEGYGDEFMLGSQKPGDLPLEVLHKVQFSANELKSKVTDFSFEWAFDGTNCWIVQLNLVSSKMSSSTIYPGNPEEFFYFDVSRGLEELRGLVSQIGSLGKKGGIILKGKVGLTSHFGEVLRNSGIPSRIEE
jgi:hypothetical protein